MAAHTQTWYVGTKLPTYNNWRKPILKHRHQKGRSMPAAKKTSTHSPSRQVERIQTGVRLEKRLLKVLKGLAESLDLSLGDLLEGIALHALENKPPFSAGTLKKIADLKRIYDLDLTATDSHQLRE